jgi:isoleucyl-tRNA synthetase
VKADSGTGIVHQAPAFGEDDHRIAIREGIAAKDEPLPAPFDEQGLFTDEVPDFAGMSFKDADKSIMKKLKEQGNLIVQGQTKHSYPFCWRLVSLRDCLNDIERVTGLGRP